MNTDRNKERGWALVSVLWTVTALSMLAAAAQSLTATGLQAEQRAWERAKANALLDAGVHAAVLALVTRSQAWRTDGSPRDFMFEGQSLRIAIQDERGRIDLNAADASLLRELFLSVGTIADEADRIVANILDWRSPSGVGSPNAVTEARYKAIGYRPRHGAFQTVDELSLVAGVSRDLFDQVAPALTVYSRLSTVERNVAPREVLAVMNRTGVNVDEILRFRFGRGAAGVPGAPAATIPLAGRAFSISVETELEGRQFTRAAVVLLTGDNAHPYLSLAWL